jgi:hypothetical protein
MAIEFRCTQCQRLLRTPDESVGNLARCPQCGLVQTVPTPPGPASAAPEAPPASPPEPGPAVDAAPLPGWYGDYEAYRQYALNRVSTPATLLMVFSAVAATLSLCCLPGATLHHFPQNVHLPAGLSVIHLLVFLAANVVIFLGAARMRNLQNYGMSLTAAIVAVVPLSLCCCWFFMPLGIWCLVVLNDPYVKAVFRP